MIMKQLRIIAITLLAMTFLTGCGSKQKVKTYDSVSKYVDGYAIVYSGIFYGFIDTSGKLVIPCIYTEAKDFSGGKAKVEKYSQKLTINKQGEEL